MATNTRLKRKAKGQRPHFFSDPAVDKVVAMVMGLAGEVAVMRDRMDTIEQLLETRGLVKRTEIESFINENDHEQHLYYPVSFYQQQV